MLSKATNPDQTIAFDLAEDDRARIDQFTRYFAELQPVLLPFLVTRTGGDPSAASDCLQEVAVVLWKKYEASWSLEDFRRYGYRCADIEARSYRRKCHRLGKRVVYLAPDVIQALGTDTKELAAEEPELGRRRLDALQLCLDGLDPVQRELLDARYDKEGEGKSIADIAKERDCKMEALYKRLERIRTSLQNCILKRLKEVST
jgi:RNA polymerase sigma-70 factor, ECF subfamily